MRRKALTLFALTIVLNSIISQELIHEWSFGLENNFNSFSIANASCSDSLGNIYITGSFSDSLDFNPGSGIHHLYNEQFTAIYLASYNKYGGFRWAFEIGKIGFLNQGSAIKVDNKGYLYLTGTFFGLVDFDPDTSVTSLLSDCGSDCFFAKYDTLGNFVWVKHIDGNYETFGKSIQIAPSGNIYLAGWFRDPTDFDPGVGSYIITSINYTRDAFAAKYNSDGEFIWAKSIQSHSNLPCNGMDIDNNGNCFLVGSFSDSADFDPGPDTFMVHSQYHKDIYILKLDSSGNFVWIETFGGTSDDEGNAIYIDDLGSIYSTGNFKREVDFDSGPGTCLLDADYTSDVFICKHNNDGLFQWAQRIGGTGGCNGTSIISDHQGFVYAVGDFTGSITYGDGNGSTLFESNNRCVFASIFDQQGNFKWATPYCSDSLSESYGYSIEKGASETISLAGCFYSEIDFDPSDSIPALNTGIVSDKSLFLAKFRPCYPTSSSIYDTACTAYLSPSGNHIWSTPGQHSDTIENHQGCDSVIFVYLTLNSTYAEIEENSCGPFDFNGNTLYINGTYHDTLINAVGCDSIITLNLTVIQPDISVIQNGPTLTANTQNAIYQWIDCDNNQPIAGQTFQSFSPTLSGVYAVVVTENGCTDTSSCYTILIDIEELEADDSTIKIYPNPAKEKLFVELPQSHPVLPSRIEILNAQGQIVLQKEIGTESIVEVDVKGLVAGEYFVRVQNGIQQIHMQKVTVH